MIDRADYLGTVYLELGRDYQNLVGGAGRSGCRTLGPPEFRALHHGDFARLSAQVQYLWLVRETEGRSFLSVLAAAAWPSPVRVLFILDAYWVRVGRVFHGWAENCMIRLGHSLHQGSVFRQ